jgi:hypothetical protein
MDRVIIDTGGASCEARRPWGGASRQCAVIHIVPLGSVKRRSLRGTFRPEPLRRGDDQIGGGALIGIQN